MRRNLTMIAGCAWVLAGCFEGADGPALSTATVGTSEDGRRIYVASAEDNAVVLVDREARMPDRAFEGGGPTRIARSGDRVLFTLSDDYQIALATDSEEGLSEIATLDMEGSPFGVVIEPSGARAYVSSPLSSRVDEIDLMERTITRTFVVEGEPSGLAIHPASETLYAAGASGNVWASIDLRSDRVTQHEIPAWIAPRYVLGDGEVAVLEYELVPRLTGDPAVTPDGGALLLPAVYEPRLADESVTATAAGLVQAQAALIVVPLGTDGAPLIDRLRVTSTQPFVVAGLPAVPESLPLAGGRPSSVTVAPGSSYALVTHEPLPLAPPGSPHLVVAVPIREAAAQVSALTADGSMPGTYSSGTLAIPGMRPGLSSSLSIPASLPFAIVGDRGLRGITFSGTDTVWIHADLARNVSRLDTRAIESALYDADSAVRYRSLRSIVIEPPIGF